MTILSLCRACTRSNCAECEGGDCEHARGERRARWTENFVGLLALAFTATAGVWLGRALLVLAHEVLR